MGYWDGHSLERCDRQALIRGEMVPIKVITKARYTLFANNDETPTKSRQNANSV